MLLEQIAFQYGGLGGMFNPFIACEYEKMQKVITVITVPNDSVITLLFFFFRFSSGNIPTVFALA